MYRYWVLSFLQTFREGGVAESEIQDWAVQMVQQAGFTSTMTSFRDKSLATGHFLLDFLSACKPDAVHREFITPGDDGTCDRISMH